MSTTATSATSVRRQPRESAPRMSPPFASRAFVMLTIGSVLAILLAGLWVSPGSVTKPGWPLLVWAGFIALVGLAPVATTDGPQLGMDLPLLLAAGFLYGPLVAGLLAFVAYVDLREVRGKISHTRAAYNRAQTSLSAMSAALVFGVLGGEVGDWPGAVFAATVALGVDCLVNYSMVVIAVTLSDQGRARQSLSRLKFGPGRVFVLMYGCFGFLGLLLAESYIKLGAWGLCLFVFPVVLGWLAFSQGRRLDETVSHLDLRGRAIESLSGRIADERREERLAVAAGLHDEVLPPLYQVHLMGQVLRQDLSQGRLLALEEDLPQLLAATDEASEALRSLIRDLRASPLGPGGLYATLRLLATELEATNASIRIDLDFDEGEVAAMVQLLAYQVAREALRNAVKHAQATRVHVRVLHESSYLKLIVADDGRGFDPSTVDTTQHFGLQLMRERIELFGGDILVDSKVGAGTNLVARFPT
jgi:signal transduction histidine kinase